MNLTIEQAIRQGVSAHKEGNLEEAERLYRAILHSQPTHADANHNLGVLAIAATKIDAALPLFKMALDANPKIEQFWLSYIDALIKDKQFGVAKRVIKKAKKQGFSGNNLNSLRSQIPAIPKKERPNDASPPQKILNSLLEYYEAGKYDDAEKLSISITKKFPKHPFGWKVLGATLKQAGRLNESLVVCQKSVQLSPQDAEAHNNLGVTLEELARLNEAEESYRQAIALKPDYSDAHSNLGVTLQALSRLGEAEEIYRQAIALKPDSAEAHLNFGNTLLELGRLDEAEASYRQTISLKPEFPEVHHNLGIMLLELSRLDEAEESFRRVIELKPDYADVHNKLLKCLFLQDKQTHFDDELNYLINSGEVNSVLGSLINRSALRYGTQKTNLFCENPLSYVLHTNLNNQYNFKKIFIDKIRDILDQKNISGRGQPLLINGYQTSGNLFKIDDFSTENIQEVIRLEIEKFRIKFKDTEAGIIKYWPDNYDLYGWVVSMKSGGELRPHIHDKGWLSGSIYISIPSKLDADSGNLVVSVGEDSDVRNKDENPKEIIDVATGSLVLFPASLTHYTIPFESEEERIVLAFDVLPK